MQKKKTLKKMKGELVISLVLTPVTILENIFQIFFQSIYEYIDKSNIYIFIHFSHTCYFLTYLFNFLGIWHEKSLNCLQHYF